MPPKKGYLRSDDHLIEDPENEGRLITEKGQRIDSLFDCLGYRPSVLVVAYLGDDINALIRLSGMSREWRERVEEVRFPVRYDPDHLPAGLVVNRQNPVVEYGLQPFREQAYRARERRGTSLWVQARSVTIYSILYSLVSAGLRDFSGLDLSGFNFRGRNLSGFSFRGCTLIGSSFEDAIFDETNPPDFSSVDLTNANFSGCRLRGANFTRAGLQGANFNSADLTNAQFGRAAMDRVNLTGSRLYGASFADPWHPPLQPPGRGEDPSGRAVLSQTQFADTHLARWPRDQILLLCDRASSFQAIYQALGGDPEAFRRLNLEAVNKAGAHPLPPLFMVQARPCTDGAGKLVGYEHPMTDALVKHYRLITDTAVNRNSERFGYPLIYRAACMAMEHFPWTRE